MTDKKAYLSIGLLSILVLTFLFWLIYFNPGSATSSDWITFLPSLNAFFNSLTAVLLLSGFIQIKKGNERRHIQLMLSATFSSACFLIGYITYHHFHGDSKFMGAGFIRNLYFFILISHILLSMIQVPLIFTTLFHGLRGNRVQHKKFARYTFPIWLYVSVTGVLIFLFLNF